MHLLHIGKGWLIAISLHLFSLEVGLNPDINPSSTYEEPIKYCFGKALDYRNEKVAWGDCYVMDYGRDCSVVWPGCSVSIYVDGRSENKEEYRWKGLCNTTREEISIHVSKKGHYAVVKGVKGKSIALLEQEPKSR